MYRFFINCNRRQLATAPSGDCGYKLNVELTKVGNAGALRLPKLPESTQRKQATPNKGSLFYSHCDCVRILYE
jgi:hypothetical protein